MSTFSDLPRYPSESVEETDTRSQDDHGTGYAIAIVHLTGTLLVAGSLVVGCFWCFGCLWWMLSIPILLVLVVAAQRGERP